MPFGEIYMAKWVQQLKHTYRWTITPDRHRHKSPRLVRSPSVHFIKMTAVLIWLADQQGGLTTQRDTRDSLIKRHFDPL